MATFDYGFGSSRDSNFSISRMVAIDFAWITRFCPVLTFRRILIIYFMIIYPKVSSKFLLTYNDVNNKDSEMISFSSSLFSRYKISDGYRVIE